MCAVYSRVRIATNTNVCATNANLARSRVVTPEKFHEWNPSVGLDCKPWDLQSYCIVTQRRLDSDEPRINLSTVVLSSTTSASFLGTSVTMYKSSPTIASSTSLSVQVAISSSDAVKNRALFGMYY